MILNVHIPSNEVLKSELLKNEAFILSHGSLDITIKDNDAILELKDDRFTHFQLTINKAILDELGIKNVIIDNIYFTRNKKLDLVVDSNTGTLPIINNSSGKVYLRNRDILTGDISLPNIGISLIEPTPQGALTYGKNGMIYKDDFAKDIWDYIKGMLSNIKSINHGNSGGFYLPVNYLSLEYVFDALKNEETLQQFQSHMPQLNNFSFLFQELNDLIKVYLDFKNHNNNKLWPL